MLQTMNLCRLFTLLIGLWAAGTGMASAQFFLRLDGMTGSTTDTNHPGWFDIYDIAGPAVSNAGTNSSTASFQEFCLIKSLDDGSVPLTFQCAGGRTIPTGTIDFISSAYSDARFFRINLTNIYITRVNQSSGGESPQEVLCLYPRSYSWNYTKFQTTNGLPATFFSGNWNIPNQTGGYSTNNPVFMNTGIRSAGGIILQWVSTAGRDYRIYAVPSLTKPFNLVTQFTAVSTGNTNYTFGSSAPAMFYVVEEVPAGF
jgi:type VI protein secretion system component Hcp